MCVCLCFNPAAGSNDMMSNLYISQFRLSFLTHTHTHTRSLLPFILGLICCRCVNTKQTRLRGSSQQYREFKVMLQSHKTFSLLSHHIKFHCPYDSRSVHKEANVSYERVCVFVCTRIEGHVVCLCTVKVEIYVQSALNQMCILSQTRHTRTHTRQLEGALRMDVRIKMHVQTFSHACDKHDGSL